ncbi:MAG: ATP-binding cassette domain-containing protein, partial [Firmicutes bacterium]|nr:ATP-binding cassette domain-containing protein [Candidatus Scatoplasma merdavium]
MYKIKNLSFTYPSNKAPALQDINLELPSTGLVYLIGESGSGKTTFINVLAGILTNYCGSLTCDKRELSSFSLEEKNDYLLKLVSIANQQDSFEESLTVLENLNVGFDIIDLSKEEKIARIEELSKLLKVDSLLKRKIRELSGGEVKRINLLRALIRDTPVYLLDEPLGPLDER